MSNDNTQLARIESRIDKTVTAATGFKPGGSINFTSMEQVMEAAKYMAIAQVAIPKHLRENPGACLAICIQAGEWELSPFAVANKTYVVNDRLAFEAQLIAAVILRRAPIKGRIKYAYSGEGAKRRCKTSATLNDGEVVEYESPELSAIPVKNSPLWKNDPDQQLGYFSARAMCRRHFPDVILGIYTPEELGEAITVDAPKVQAIPQGKVGTVMQLAAAEKEKPAKVLDVPPEDEAPTPPAEAPPEPPQEPGEADAADLLRDLDARIAAINVGRGKLKKVLVANQMMDEGAAFTDLTAAQLTAILDVWEDAEKLLTA